MVWGLVQGTWKVTLILLLLYLVFVVSNNGKLRALSYLLRLFSKRLTLRCGIITTKAQALRRWFSIKRLAYTCMACARLRVLQLMNLPPYFPSLTTAHPQICCNCFGGVSAPAGLHVYWCGIDWVMPFGVVVSETMGNGICLHCVCACIHTLRRCLHP